MKNQRSIVLFLAKFFLSYFLLFVIYSYYLQKFQSKDNGFACAPVTTQVASHTSKVLSFVGYDNSYLQHDKELSVKLMINDRYTARVIEGCNSVSIIILFLAFIIAFSGPWKTILLYGIVGSALIYSVNILRIAFLTVMLYKFPEQQTLLHNFVFPAIIYGFTFLLWVVWVRKFSHHKK